MDVVDDRHLTCGPASSGHRTGYELSQRPTSGHRARADIHQRPEELTREERRSALLARSRIHGSCLDRSAYLPPSEVSGELRTYLPQLSVRTTPNLSYIYSVHVFVSYLLLVTTL